MIIMRKWMVVVAFVLALSIPFEICNAFGTVRPKGRVRVFDVTKYGARGDGKPIYDEDGESINGLKIMAAWRAACGYKRGPSKVLIPNGTYVVAQTCFSGPCNFHVTIELQGIIIPDPDVSQFPNQELLTFQQVNNVTLTGSGSINAINRGPPKSKDPNRDIDFFNLLPLIKFYNATNAKVEGIHCKNPAAFHILVVLSQNISINNVTFDAKFLAPQSDTSGVYISASSQVTVFDSFIRTGDNCITIGPGSSHVHVHRVTCSAGQGISIGADPIDPNLLNVKNVTVKNCTFQKTAFGAGIFPRREDNHSLVSNIVFENLLMENVKQSIVIHQKMPRRPNNKTILAKVKCISINNIRGTTSSRFGVTISCNPKLPCEHIEVANVHLKHLGKFPSRKSGSGLLGCSNPQVLFEGKHDQLSCGILS